MLDKSQVALLLGSTEIFSKLQPKHLEVIANASKVVRFEERARIVTKGEIGQELYIIGVGKVSIVQEETNLGIEQPILSLGPGQSFGEASLLAESPRSATAKALTECVCVVLAKRSFDSVLSQIPEVGLAISRYLAARLHHQCQLTGFRFVSYQDLVFDPELYGTFPEELLRRLKAIPLSLNDGTLTVALTKPNQASTIQSLRSAAPGLAIEPVACTSEDYQAFMRRHRPVRDEAPVVALGSANRGEVEFRMGSGELISEPLSTVLNRALSGQLSHVLVQPAHAGLKVLSPVEGGLKLLMELGQDEKGPSLQEQLQRLFFETTDQPEVNTTSIQVDQDRCYLQLSQLPTLSGPRFSIRLLDPKRTLPPITQLMPHDALREVVVGKLLQPGQLVVLAGSARSGRSTTVYSLMHHLWEDHGLENILTLEQRPLANIPEIPQVKVQKDWDAAVEAALVQAPELLVFDEIDLATFPLISRVADAGHTSLACLSSSHPIQDLARLSQDGDGPGVSLDALGLLVQQTLLPRLCNHCRVDYIPSSSVKSQLVRNSLADNDQLFFHSAGCSKCRGSGILGKVAVLEALTLTPMVRELIRAGRPEEAILKSAQGSGLLMPFSLSARVLLKQGELGTTTAMRFSGRAR
jgi:type IV pilus assembly protein PilB